MKKIFLALLLLPSVCLTAQKKAGPTTYAKTITTDDLKRHLYIIAGPEMEGRETATEGQRKAAAYIETQFRNLGLLPGYKGEYQMQYPVYRDSLVNAGLEVNGQTYELDKDFVTSNGNFNGVFRFSEVVFAGYGISDSTRDDYKGIDVKGKLVIIIPGNPPGKTVSAFAKAEAAQKNGAAAVLFVSTDFPRRNKTNPRGGMYVNAFRRSYPPFQFTISEKLAETIMGGEYAQAKAGTVSPKAYPANVMLNFNKQTTVMQSSNVMGLLEGSDLKDEYVFITAHYDHLGKRDTVIYYGADDDGSGTVGVIELAEAFIKAKAEGKGPRRSIVFMTVSGEEKGLWGSAYYANHPVFPLEKTTVDLNIDMIGRSDTSRKKGDLNNYVYVVGDDKISSDLKLISEDVNKKYTKMELDYKFNDPNDRNRIYFRSDHYNFAQKGVPIIFYYDGMLGGDYHRSTDTPDKINYELLVKRAQLVFYTAWEMANRNEMLRRDLKLEVPRGF
jgi:hypothetical protein